jgi:hypothetical protein
MHPPDGPLERLHSPERWPPLFPYFATCRTLQGFISRFQEHLFEVDIGLQSSYNLTNKIYWRSAPWTWR